MTKSQAIAKAKKASLSAFDYCFACKTKSGWRLLNWPGGTENHKFYCGVKV